MEPSFYYCVLNGTFNFTRAVKGQNSKNRESTKCGPRKKRETPRLNEWIQKLEVVKADFATRWVSVNREQVGKKGKLYSLKVKHPVKGVKQHHSKMQPGRKIAQMEHFLAVPTIIVNEQYLKGRNLVLLHTCIAV